MREEGGVEIETAVVLLSELYPSLEVTGLDGVTVYNLAVLSDSIVCVNVDLVGSGDEGESLVKVCEKLVGVASAAGVVTGSLNTAGKLTGSFKSLNVVCLPAVHRNANIGKSCDSRFGVNAVSCINFLSGLVSCVCHNDLLCIMYFLFFAFYRAYIVYQIILYNKFYLFARALKKKYHNKAKKILYFIY